MNNYLYGTRVLDGHGRNLADVGDSKQLAATPYPGPRFRAVAFPFFNPVYGIDVNQDAGFSGTPELVYDGNDTVAWTGSNVSGSWYADSTEHFHTGTKSAEFDSGLVGNVTQFLRSSPISLSGNFEGLTFWLYVHDGWDVGDVISLQGYLAGSPVGTSISLGDYFDSGVFGKWIKVPVTMAEMGLGSETIDAFRFEVVSRSLPKLTFYVDDFQLEETQNTLVFALAPFPGTWMHVSRMTATMVREYDSSVGLGYADGFLGLSLSTGLIYQEISGGVVTFSANAVSLLEMLQGPITELMMNEYDGTNTWVKFASGFLIPRVLRSETNDLLTFSITENWSSFKVFRVLCEVIIEDRTGM